MLRIGTDFACSLFFKILVWVPRLELGAAKGKDPGRRGRGLVPSEDVGWRQAELPLGLPKAGRMARAQK